MPTAVALIVCACLLALPALAAGGEVTPALRDRVATTAPEETIPVIVTLQDQVDADDYAGRRAALITALRRTAARTQPDVLDNVDGEARRFWLINALAVEATPAEIADLGADPEVATVDLDRPVRVTDAPRIANAIEPFPDPGEGNWGIAASRVPQTWARFGVTGRDIRVGSIDTGVDPDNPSLRGKVVAWRDFIAGRPAPYDDNGHGTHTIGTMVGGEVTGSPVGVAPGARAVVAKAIGRSGVGPGSALLAAAEWMTDPDGDPATADHPVVVNNSWSADNPNDPWFRDMIRRWLELGIVPVFAAGNSGPGPETIGSPAGYPETLAVGAVDTDQTLAEFSSRGPVRWQDADGTGPVAGTPFTKPDLVAPGVGITSGVGPGFLSFSGTSMASPHVAGLVALLAEANPAVRGETAIQLLRATSADMGAAGPDTDFGYGMVNAEAAVAAAVGASAQATTDTRFTLTPGRVSRRTRVAFDVAVQGAAAWRWRVDGGAWSAPVTGRRLHLSLREGRHVVQAQAVTPETGETDTTPARHVVIVDRTPPRLEIRVTRRRDGALLRASAADTGSRVKPTSLRWTLPGATRWGSTARVPAAARGLVRVRLAAKDRAGNRAVVTRTIRLTPR